ncbi:MAG TPA: exonuclease SbcCD subunit D C-terminal domain-containing protein, partial [Pseudogracilibacillus sp.]|nr:exonuclease SbcCD subunit D C-terminal domain-containing protein [Pseudogracilibacillus sp.]
VEMDEKGDTTIEKRKLTPRRDMRRVEATMDEILLMEKDDDYVFVTLLDDTPVLSPMEKIRSIFPNAMHVTRHFDGMTSSSENDTKWKPVKEMTDTELFQAFYEEVKGFPVNEDTEKIFTEVLDELLKWNDESIDLKQNNAQTRTEVNI